jgi:hypothetical protein
VVFAGGHAAWLNIYKMDGQIMYKYQQMSDFEIAIWLDSWRHRQPQTGRILASWMAEFGRTSRDQKLWEASNFSST